MNMRLVVPCPPGGVIDSTDGMIVAETPRNRTLVAAAGSQPE